MAAHAGQKAEKSSDFHCAKCEEQVRVKKRRPIPKCPNGHTVYRTQIG